MAKKHHPFTCTQCWQDRWNDLDGALGERRAQLLLQLSGYAHRAGKWSQALELAEQSLDIYLQDAMRREEQADAVAAIAMAKRELGCIDEAYAHLHAALDIFREVKCSYTKIWDNTLCWWLFQDKRYDESLTEYLRTLENHRADKDIEGTTYDTLMVGSCLLHLQRYSEALGYFQEARVLAKSIDDQRHLAMADFNIGESLVHMGQGFEGETYCRKALAVFELYEHQTYIAEAYKMIGMAQAVQGKHEDAISSLRRAATGFGRAHNKKFHEMVATNTELAKNLRIVGRSDEAAEIERRTSSIKELL